MSIEENNNHALENGLNNFFGENTVAAKLDNKKVLEIKKLLKQGKSRKFIASLFEVQPWIIGQIRLEKVWSHVILED